MCTRQFDKAALSLVAVTALVGGFFIYQPLRGQQPKPEMAPQPCTIVAFEQVRLHATVPGVLKEMKADIGDRVKRGDVLAVIDARPLELDLEQAQAGVQQAQAEVEEAKAGMAAAQAGVTQVRTLIAQRKGELDSAKAQINYRRKLLQRFMGLANSKSVEEHLVNEAKDRLLAAEAQAAAAEGGLENARAQMAAQESKVARARAIRAVQEARLKAVATSLEKAQFMVTQTRIVAPFDGVITQRHYFAGDFVRSDAQGDRPLPLLVIDRIDKVRVLVQVPERHAPSVKVGDPVSIKVDALPALKLQEKVSRIGFSLAADTRTMRVEIDVPNPDQRLRPGMYGTATLQVP